MERQNPFRPGDRVVHFKRALASPEELAAEPMLYFYEIVGVAINSETEEELMIYRALYGSGGLYARPLAMFLSEVDRARYPQARQRFRFEPFPNG